MSRAVWHRQIASKFFHVYYYRKLAKWLLLINILNLGLIIWIGYIFTSRNEPNFYATNGYMPPIEITAMNQANESAEALLPIDLPESEIEKQGV